MYVTRKSLARQCENFQYSLFLSSTLEMVESSISECEMGVPCEWMLWAEPADMYVDWIRNKIWLFQTSKILLFGQHHVAFSVWYTSPFLKNSCPGISTFLLKINCVGEARRKAEALSLLTISRVSIMAFHRFFESTDQRSCLFFCPPPKTHKSPERLKMS